MSDMYGTHLNMYGTCQVMCQFDFIKLFLPGHVLDLCPNLYCRRHGDADTRAQGLQVYGRRHWRRTHPVSLWLDDDTSGPSG